MYATHPPMVVDSYANVTANRSYGSDKKYKIKQEICGNCMKAGFFNVIIQDIAVQGTNA